MGPRKQQPPATTPAVEPPHDVLVHVLQHLDPTDRLQHAALVCRSWRAAAAEATTAIHVDYSEYLASEDPGDEEEAEGNIANSLARWLEKHGGALTELNLTGSEGGIIDFRLPFQRLTQLQDLRLDECYLHEYEYTSQGNADQPSSSSSSAGPLAGLSSLTYLDLADVAFAWPGSGDALSALTNLRELRLYSVQLGGEEEPAPNLDMLLPLQQLTALTVAAHPMIEEPGARVLAQLTGLRQLSIQHMEMTPKAMESFVALTNLTQLQCSYESFELQPQKFKTFRAVSEESPPKVHAELQQWLDDKAYDLETADEGDTDSEDEEDDEEDDEEEEEAEEGEEGDEDDAEPASEAE